MSAVLYDKTGREIVAGDVVKVFHFTGARRKRYFMYKQALGIQMLGRDAASAWMRFSHLDMTGEHYHEQADGRRLGGYEIVQGVNADHEDRPRINTKERSR